MAVEDPSAADPTGLPMVDLLILADAFPLLDRLALLVTMRNGGARETVIFGILERLREHLETAPITRGPGGVHEIVDVVHAWFAMRIADEEAQAAGEPR